jgi:hypothetical protein
LQRFVGQRHGIAQAVKGFLLEFDMMFLGKAYPDVVM